MLTRNELAELTERLIDALDSMDPDAEAEDEPDREDDDPAEHGGDREHSHHPAFDCDQGRRYD